MAYKKVGPPPRALPPLPHLRRKAPVKSQAAANNECMVVMSTLLNCWASNGEGASMCARFESELKQCMALQKSVSSKAKGNSQDSDRLYPKLRGKVHD